MVQFGSVGMPRQISILRAKVRTIRMPRFHCDSMLLLGGRALATDGEQASPLASNERRVQPLAGRERRVQRDGGVFYAETETECKL